MKRVLLIIWLFPTVLLAQEDGFASIVRAGEHGDFTRVALGLPTGATWKLRPQGKKVHIVEFSQALSLDLSRVFDRINRARLDDVKAGRDGHSLTITLACDCAIESFDTEGGLLVLDIQNDRAEQTEENAAPVQFPEPLPVIWPVALTSVLKGNPPTQPALNPPEIKAGNQVSIDQVEKRLRDGIIEATRWGLLQRTSDALTELNGGTEEVDHDNLRLHDPVTGLVETEPAQVGDRPRTACLHNGSNPMASWSIADFSTSTGILRAQVFGEFDRPDKAALEELTKSYLYFGFGAEAKQLLKLSQWNDDTRAELELIADIVDRARGSAVKAEGFQCEGAAALWEALAARRIPAGLDVSGIGLEFAQLPTHLQRHLGPELSVILTQAGHTDVGAYLLRALERGETIETPWMEIAKAEIALATEEPDAAKNHLAQAASLDEDGSASALLELVQIHLSEMQPITQDVADVFSSYATGLRGTELGSHLARFEPVAFALARDFQRAFAIQESQGQDAEEKESKLTSERVWRVFSALASDPEIVRIGLARISENGPSLPSTVSVGLAKRLIDMGFATRARYVLLNSAGDADRSEGFQTLLARTSIEVGLPHRALVDLMAVEGKDADALRARALALNGELALAADLVGETDPIEAGRLNWLAGEAEQRRETQREELSIYSDLMLKFVELSNLQSDESLPALAQGEQLISLSRHTRQVAMDMLGSIPENP